MNDNEKLMKHWQSKKSTFYLRIGGKDAIPFVFEKGEKYRIDKYRAYYCSGGVWNKLSSEETDLKDIIIFFNAKFQKAVLEEIGEAELPIDFFVCCWHEAIRGNRKILLLNRILEKEDEFEVSYMDFFRLGDVNKKLVEMLLQDILPKIFDNAIPSGSNFFLENLGESISNI